MKTINSLESFSYTLVLEFPASTSMHIIYHDHAVNKFTKLVTLDLLATNVLSGAKVQLIKISAILKNLDFWSTLYIYSTALHQAPSSALALLGQNLKPQAARSHQPLLGISHIHIFSSWQRKKFWRSWTTSLLPSTTVWPTASWSRQTCKKCLTRPQPTTLHIHIGFIQTILVNSQSHILVTLLL